MKKLLLTAAMIVSASFANAHDIVIKDDNAIMSAESFNFEEGSYTSKKNLIIVFKNNSDKPVRAFKTVLFCNDLFGDKLFRSSYKDASANLKPGEEKRYNLDVPGMVMYADLDISNFTCGIEETVVAQ